MKRKHTTQKSSSSAHKTQSSANANSTPPRLELVLPGGKLESESLEGQLRIIEQALVRAESDLIRAARSISKKGMGVVVEVGDHNGKFQKRVRVNPAVRILRETRKTIAMLKIERARLKEALLRERELEQRQAAGDEFNW